MPECYVRVDVYVRADSLDDACEKVVDALSGISNDVFVVDGMKEPA